MEENIKLYGKEFVKRSIEVTADNIKESAENISNNINSVLELEIVISIKPGELPQWETRRKYDTIAKKVKL